jgi:putative tricarboxylic transport membrane protein
VTRFRADFWIGIGVVVLGLVLALLAVPEGVVTPKHVRIAVLSPAFWPNILAWLLVALGTLLAVPAARPAAQVPAPVPARGGLARLALLTAGVVVFCLFATTLGLAWACMLLFAGTALLTGTEHRAAAVAVTLLLPLALYAFFAHVAAVPIPQGHFVTLP